MAQKGMYEGSLWQRKGQGKDKAAGSFEGQADSQICYLYLVALGDL